MSRLSNLITWTPVYYERPKWIKPVITALVIGGSLLLVSVALKSNSVRSLLPATIQGYLLTMEENLAGVFTGGDTVVLTKHIKGKKLLRKSAGMEKHAGGFVSYQYQKKFRLTDKVSATVAVDKFATKSEAMMAAKKRGGNRDDQLMVGRPSFMEIHGLNKRNNYYLTGVTREGASLVTITLTRKLTDGEKAKASGVNYEAMMEDLFEQHFEKVQSIASTQVKRLARN